MFPAPDGGPVRASLFRRRFWYPACVAAGYGTLEKDEAGQKHYSGLRLHDLRHSAVALWIAAGASAKEVAVRAGHTSVSVVLDRYGHLLPGTEERVTDALDAMAKGAANTPRVASVASLRLRISRDSSRTRQLDGCAVSWSARHLHSDLRKLGGRYGTRTHDLCRVKAAL